MKASAKPRPARKRTGEKRERNSRLNLDWLPVEMREWMLARYSAGATWAEIEQESPGAPGWDNAPASLSLQYPDRRIPHSTWHRYYDLRFSQVKAEIEERLEFSREFARVFAGSGFEKLPEAIVNAYRDTAFRYLQSSNQGDNDKALEALRELGLLKARFDTVELKKRKVKVEERDMKLREDEGRRKQAQFDKATNDAASKLGKGKTLDIEDINRLRKVGFGLDPIQ